MGWVYIGRTTHSPGSAVTVWAGVTVDGNYTAVVASPASPLRRKFGILEYCRTDIIPSSTEVVLITQKPLWFIRTNFRIGNGSAGGFVRFYAYPDVGAIIELDSYRFSP